MKKLFSILFLAVFVLSVMAQERTVFINTTASNGLPIDMNTTKTVVYTGTASDYLIPTTRDTIDFYVLVNNYGPGNMHFWAEFKLAPITGADTTVSITALYKNSPNQSYSTLIAAATTSAVTTTIYPICKSLGVVSSSDTASYKYYPVGEPNPAVNYRYLCFRLILKGNDSVGTGIKVQRIEIQFYQI